MAGPYTIGNVIRLKANWTDPNNNGVAIDPSVVIFRYADPNGAVTSYTYPTNVVKEATGVYHLDVVVSLAGVWWYDAISTGTAQARAESSFQVLATKIP